jgi:hypothetical protein
MFLFWQISRTKRFPTLKQFKVQLSRIRKKLYGLFWIGTLNHWKLVIMCIYIFTLLERFWQHFFQ